MAGAYRQLMDEARLSLHEYMSVPALYFMWTPNAENPLGATQPRTITVRPYITMTSVGGLKGTSQHYAEREDIEPSIQFLLAEISPKKGFYVSLADGRVFRLDAAKPVDGLTQRVTVIRAEPGDYPLPGKHNFAKATMTFPAFGS